MITTSITHVLQSTLQYIALIASLLLYRWIKDIPPFSSSTHTTRKPHPHYHVFKGLNIRSLILDRLFMCNEEESMKDLRKKSGLTQEEFAEVMGVDVRTVQRWEQGTRPQPRHYDRFQRIRSEFTEKPSNPRISHRHPGIYQRNNYTAGGKFHYQRFSYEPSSSRYPTILVITLITIIFIETVVILVFLALRFWFHII